MLSQEEVTQQISTELRARQLPFANKYLKLCSEFNSPLENARAVFSNYCARDLLKWAPTTFQRMGKNRTTSNVKELELILSDSSITSVAMLVKRITDQVKDYSLDSSLLKRLQFICAKEGIPYEIVANEKSLSILIGESLEEKQRIVNNSLETPPAMIPSQLLWQTYRQFPLLNEYNEPEVIAAENRDYRDVIVIDDPQKLKKGVAYLYVVTLEGNMLFAPQFAPSGRKLTHGALARKANLNQDGLHTTAVLAAGAIMVGTDAAIYNLASGHFAPEVPAYIPLSEALSEKLPNYTLLAQFGGGVNSHFKSLDERRCNKLNLIGIKESRDFKLSLLSYIQQYKQEGNLLGTNSKLEIATKILSAINTAGSEYNEDIRCRPRKVEDRGL